MSKHAEGPWSIATAAGDKNQRLIILSSENIMVAEVGFNPRNMESNADLIAAAPELLEYAKKVRSHFDGQWAPVEISGWDKVIAKAEGTPQ